MELIEDFWPFIMKLYEIVGLQGLIALDILLWCIAGIFIYYLYETW